MYQQNGQHDSNSNSSSTAAPTTTTAASNDKSGPISWLTDRQPFRNRSLKTLIKAISSSTSSSSSGNSSRATGSITNNASSSNTSQPAAEHDEDNVNNESQQSTAAASQQEQQKHSKQNCASNSNSSYIGNSLHLKPNPSPSTNSNTTTNSVNENDNFNTTNNNNDNDNAAQRVAPAGTDDECLVQDGPEVFLGGSCNPTTWRADVAIPTLNKLGISFYNPQVSDWTPDLIELEHRAKEKARVLFFVMDSETRASAGAIEAAHIAGSNAKQLVLVLHPYKREQRILNEPISRQEFIDLSRNQNLLRVLVIRRGLPILDSIPSGLQRTKAILLGLEDGRSPPSNIASRLISVRRAFDRLVGKNDDEITVHECQIALTYLGYANSILSEENIRKILQVHRDITSTTKISKHDIIFRRQTSSSSHQLHHHHKCSTSAASSSGSSSSGSSSGRSLSINFEEFCVISAYLSVMQQELNENTCVSPIKGTNLPPPPIFLTNAPEWIHNRSVSSFTETTQSSTVTEDGVTIRQKQFYNLRLKSSVSRESQRGKRDSGTSSPLPQEQQQSMKDHPHLLEHTGGSSVTAATGGKHLSSGSSLNRHLSAPSNRIEPLVAAARDIEDDDESNDSVFSDDASSTSSDVGVEMRDIYLGGSCMRRTRWRQDYVIPQLKSRGISYHNPDDFDGSLSMGDVHALVESTSKLDVERRREEHGHETATLKRRNPTTMSGPIIAGGGDNRERHNAAAVGSGDVDDNEDDDDDANQLRQMLEEPIFDPSLLDASRVLLFVITNETRSLAPMTLAAHYIGLGYDVVLCVQMLTDSIIYGNERLTQTAIKDYNRGRQYLIDLAKRQRIPVYEDIQAATDCAIEKANMRKSIASI